MFCMPGDRLSISDDKNTGGKGTFIRGSYIYSALAGRVNIIQNNDEKTIQVTAKNDITKKIPSIGDVVTCKVDKITSNRCKCTIHCIGDQVLKSTFIGVIRKEDVREIDKDLVDIYKCFRPGDVILAKVLGFSDYGYLLTTAANDLGVIVAKSEYDVMMIPVSWTEMICPKTLTKEPRKVAKLTNTNQEDNQNAKCLKSTPTSN